MINPFQYGGVVGKGAFCNRRKELVDLKRAMENGERIFVYSERRMGKTSLVRRIMAQLPRKRFLCAYADLWPTDDEVSFAAAIAKAITESLGGTANRMLQSARSWFGRMAPSITTDYEGNAKISFAMNRESGAGPQLDEVLSAPARIARRRKSRVVIVLDEFQQVLEYGGNRVERKLRSAIQDQKNVSYVFLGSRKHLIQKMFLDQSRPLYRSGGHYALGPIALKHWLPFIRKRFREYRRTITDDQIESLCRITGGHPFYTQHLCHALWELCVRGGKVSEEMIEDAVRLLLERESYAYTALWESLAVNQQRFLKGLAHEQEGVKVFSADFLRRHGLRSPSGAQRVVSALLEKDIIDRDNGSFVIIDRFFRIWIQRMQTPITP
jgi:AAA+ ATPase superfamily predicted ATPase